MLIVLGFGIFSNSSEALAMTSKGAIKFQTDANTYSKHATSIVVTGTMSNHELNEGVVVDLLNPCILRAFNEDRNLAGECINVYPFIMFYCE